MLSGSEKLQKYFTAGFQVSRKNNQKIKMICTMKSCLQPLIVFGIILLPTNFICGQSNVVNKYGLVVVKTLKILHEEITIDSNKQMLSLRKEVPNIQLDLKYATKNNFMRSRLYPHLNNTYLRLPAIKALKQIVKELKIKNLSLKVFDAYRPYSVTEKM